MIGMCISSGNISENSAILKVTVLTGSIVTMTKSGITLIPTIWTQATDNTLDCALFVISPGLLDSQNAWTVIAVINGNSISKTITISAAKQYDLEVIG